MSCSLTRVALSEPTLDGVPLHVDERATHDLRLYGLQGRRHLLYQTLRRSVYTHCMI